jgi:SAM-dependent methyltransferase
MATRMDIERFLAETELDPYQSMPLPYGLSTPGRSRFAEAEDLFNRDIAGLSVLDVGTNYGFFAFEAARRGASRVVGIEPDPERLAVARTIAEFNGGSYEIRAGRAEDLDLGERFDLVMMINVLHHVPDPVSALRSLVAHCRDSVYVVFPKPSEPRFLAKLDGRLCSGGVTAIDRLRAGVRRRFVTRLLRWAGRDVPLVGVGADPYETFYFTPEAFRWLFTIHIPLFSEVHFADFGSPHRVLATCKVSRDPPEVSRGPGEVKPSRGSVQETTGRGHR